MRFNKCLMAVCFGTVTLQGAGSVFADDDRYVLEEIIVTATKREQSLLELPMSISALGERDLERIGADNFEGFAALVPGLALNPNGANSAKFSIRGITTSTTRSSTQAPVAIYHDELPVLDSFGPFVTPELRLFDINRVEVLRGPQGTLFGSGSLGGAIRVITNKPRFNESEVKIASTVAAINGGDESLAFNAMTNLPLIEDELALRAVAYYRNDGGYVDNVARGDDDVDSQQSLGGRLMLKWDANKSLSFLLTIMSQDDEPNDGPFTFVDGPDDQYDSFTEQPASLNFTTTNLVAEYDFGSVILTASSTVSSRSEHLRNDISAAFQPAVASLGITSGVLSEVRGKTDVFAHEVRLTSVDDSAFQWLVGAFYLDADRSSFESASAEGANSVLMSFGLPTAGPHFPSDSLFGAAIDLNTSETALFGEASYQFSEQLSATVGARWFRNTQDIVASASGLFAQGLPITDRDTTDKSITPKVSVSYRPYNNIHYYAQAAKGYRVGQNNMSMPAIPGVDETPASYDEDSLWNYELGFKADLVDGRLVIEAAAFYIDWQDIQLQQRNSAGFNYIENAGEALSKGLELSLGFMATDSLRVGSAITYNETELASVEAGVDALKGDELPGTPKFKVSNHIQWTHELGAEVNGHIRLDHSFSSAAYTALNNPAADRTDVYNTFNLNAGMDFGAWALDLFAKNLTNTHRKVNIMNIVGRRAAVRIRPLEVGVSVRATF